MKLVLLGAPGAGKSTQAQNLAAHFGVAQVTTSEVLHEYLNKQSGAGIADDELAARIRQIMTAGGLVGDEVVIELVRRRLAEQDCARGFVFDGFPRNIPQAEALAAMGGQPDAVVYINAPDDVIVERISGRAVCSGCGRIYRLHQETLKAEGICDDCGAALQHRADDRPEAVANRLQLYHVQTAPLIDFYRSQGLVLEFGVDNATEIDALTAEIVQALRGARDGHIG